MTGILQRMPGQYLRAREITSNVRSLCRLSLFRTGCVHDCLLLSPGTRRPVWDKEAPAAVSQKQAPSGFRD